MSKNALITKDMYWVSDSDDGLKTKRLDNFNNVNTDTSSFKPSTGGSEQRVEATAGAPPRPKPPLLLAGTSKVSLDNHPELAEPSPIKKTAKLTLEELEPDLLRTLADKYARSVGGGPAEPPPVTKKATLTLEELEPGVFQAFAEQYARSVERTKTRAENDPPHSSLLRDGTPGEKKRPNTMPPFSPPNLKSHKRRSSGVFPSLSRLSSAAPKENGKATARGGLGAAPSVSKDNEIQTRDGLRPFPGDADGFRSMGGLFLPPQNSAQNPLTDTPANTVRTLRVYIDGECATFEVSASVKASISQLKKIIQKERELSVLGDVDPNVLVLWKLKEPLLIKPEGSLGERIQARGSVPSTFAVCLDSSDEVSEIFPENVSTKHVHIIVWRSWMGRSEGLATKPQQDKFISDTIQRSHLDPLPLNNSPPNTVPHRLETASPSSQAAPAQTNSRRLGGPDDDSFGPVVGPRNPNTEPEKDGNSTAAHKSPAPASGTKRKAELLSTVLRPVEGKCDGCGSSRVSRECDIEDDSPKCRQCRDDNRECCWKGITRTGIRPRIELARNDDGAVIKRKIEFIGAPPPHLKKSARLMKSSRPHQSSQDKGKARATTASPAENTEEDRPMSGVEPEADVALAGEPENVGHVDTQWKEAEDEEEEAEEEEEEAESSLQPVKGSCDRCASYAKPVRCEIGTNSLKCKKCSKDTKGCYWGGISRSGRRTKRAGAWRKTRALLVGSTSAAAGAGGSTLRSARGKDKDTETQISEEVVSEERTRLRARIKVLESLYNELT